MSEYLVERMARAGVDKLCFVISPAKSDILAYFGGAVGAMSLAYVVQDAARGLCDAIFRAIPLLPRDEMVVVGLPDTIWFPSDALCQLPAGRFSFLLFPVERPELFDAVQMDADGRVQRIVVKQLGAGTQWVWGAFALPGQMLHELHALWQLRGCADEYVGTLVNAWLEGRGLRLGSSGRRALRGRGHAARLSAGGAPAGRPAGERTGELPASCLTTPRPPTGPKMPSGRAPRRWDPGSTTSACAACRPRRTTSWATSPT